MMQFRLYDTFTIVCDDLILPAFHDLVLRLVIPLVWCELCLFALNLLLIEAWHPSTTALFVVYVKFYLIIGDVVLVEGLSDAWKVNSNTLLAVRHLPQVLMSLNRLPRRVQLLLLDLTEYHLIIDALVILPTLGIFTMCKRLLLVHSWVAFWLCRYVHIRKFQIVLLDSIF